jgi:hypothetical protein
MPFSRVWSSLNHFGRICRGGTSYLLSKHFPSHCRRNRYERGEGSRSIPPAMGTGYVLLQYSTLVTHRSSSTNGNSTVFCILTSEYPHSGLLCDPILAADGAGCIIAEQSVFRATRPCCQSQGNVERRPHGFGAPSSTLSITPISVSSQSCAFFRTTRRARNAWSRI